MLVSVNSAIGTVEWVCPVVLALLVIAIVGYYVVLWAGAYGLASLLPYVELFS